MSKDLDDKAWIMSSDISTKLIVDQNDGKIYYIKREGDRHVLYSDIKFDGIISCKV